MPTHEAIDNRRNAPEAEGVRGDAMCQYQTSRNHALFANDFATSRAVSMKS